MKAKHLLFIAVLFLLATLKSFTQPQGEKLVILHTNDLHSRLEGYSPSSEYSPLSINDDNTLGGFSRIATLIKEEKAKAGDNVLVVDAGDFLMGTIFHYMEEYNGFQLPLMKDMGYDVLAIGNHEFDYGPDKLATIINKSVLRGEIPGLLLSNARFSMDSPSDDSLEKVYNDNVIQRTRLINKGGYKIGLFSLLGVDAVDVAPSSFPLTFKKQVKTARECVDKLQRDGADIIICLSHSGIEKDKKGKWTGEDVKLAKKVKGLDLIISGHTHSRLDEILWVRGTPVVQTGSYGKAIGRIELSVDNGDVKIDSYSLVKVDDSIMGDSKVQEAIDKQKKLISSKLLQPLGYNLFDTVIVSDFMLDCDEYGDLEGSNLGPLVADAIHNYINENSETGTDITLVAAGVIRDLIPTGAMSVQDIFRVMSLGSGRDSVPGYPLSTVWLTGSELKKVIEILLVAHKSSPSNYCYYAGLDVEYNPDKGILRKIKKISLQKDGKIIPVYTGKKSDQLYSVSANSYMLEFIGIIKKMTFGMVNVSPRKADGSVMDDMSLSVIDFETDTDGIQEGKEWIALLDYLLKMPDANGDGYPEMNEYYREPVKRTRPVY